MLSLEDVTVREDADAEFVVSLGAKSEREVTVSYATADDTAEASDELVTRDYTSASGSLTFAAGDRTKTITVEIEDDTVDEAETEQFKLTLSNEVNATLSGGQATLQKLGKIEDDDGAPVLSLEDVTVREDADAEFVVSLGAKSEREVTVSYATTDDTAEASDELVTRDYTSASGSLTFAAGDMTKTITVEIEDDTVDEAETEQFKLTLSNEVNATLSGGQATLQKLGKIEDDDGAPVLSLEDVTVREDADAEFVVSLGAKSEREVTVSYATTDDTAEASDELVTRDYTSASGSLTFAAGDRAKTITVEIEDDTVDEAETEQFKLTLSNEVNATLSGGQATLQKLGKIEDDDGAPVLSLEDVTVREDADAEFVVSLGAKSEREVTVSYATADDTAEASDETETRDYTSASGSLTFAAGDRAKTITVEIEDDTVDEAETEQFKLTLSNEVNATLSGGQARLQKLGKIEDDDGAPVLSLEDVTVREDADAEFVVSLDAASGREVTVSYATTDDTAKQPGDYTTASGSLTFTAGDRAKTITVTINDDTVDEEDEQFKLTLSNKVNAKLSGDESELEVKGKIDDNDDPPVLSLEDVTVREDADAEFVVSLRGESELEVTVDYATADDSAEASDETVTRDYTSASGSLTFAARETAKTITVEIEDDTVDEAETEQFKLTLSNEVNATLSGGQATLQKLGKIEDDDHPPVLSLEDVTVREDADAEFVVSLDAASGREVTVSYATTDDTAKQPGDYTTASGSLTFTAGDRAKTITVEIEDDTVDEADEQFKLTLSNEVNATLSGGQATLQKLGKIEDDDGAPGGRDGA